MVENRHNNFDIIRLFAALQVVQEHTSYWLQLPRPIWFVDLISLFPGVPIFFLVSGFLVTSSYLFGTGGAAAYFARRALRIYPALWVSSGLIVLALALTGSLVPGIGLSQLMRWLTVASISGADIYANFAAGPIVSPTGFYPFFPSLVLWTIPVELGFYLLVPIIALPALRRASPGLPYALSLAVWSALSLGAMFAYGWLKTSHPDNLVTKLLSVTTPAYLWYFLIGAAIGAYWRKLSWLFVNQFMPWLALHLAVAVADRLLFGHLAIDFHNITLLLPLHIVTLAGVVISFAYTWRDLGRGLSDLDLSYGTYLYHVPILLSLKFAGFSLGPWWWPVIIGLTLLTAAASWEWIERPALRLKRITDRWFTRPNSP